jgi:hypothetical protein
MYLPLVVYESNLSLFQDYIKVTNLDLSLFVGSSLNRTTAWGYRPKREKKDIILFSNILGAIHFIEFMQTIYPVLFGKSRLVPEEVPTIVMERECEKYLSGI